MNEHSRSGSQGISLWQRGMSLLCLLAAIVEFRCLAQRSPLRIFVTLRLPNNVLDLLLLVMGLVTFALPALLFFFEADERNEKLYQTATTTTILGVAFSLWLYAFKTQLHPRLYLESLGVLIPIQLLKVLLGRGLSRRGYASPTVIVIPPDLSLGSSATVPSSYTLKLVVCSVCSRQYAGVPGSHCPGCTAPVEDAVPLQSRQRAGWWRLWQGPTRGQRLAAMGLLLTNALFLGAHVLLLRDVAPILIALLLLDALLAALLWTPVGVGLVLARAGTGVLLAWVLFSPDMIPLVALPQAVLGLSLGVLLVHRLGGAARLLAVPGPALYAVLVGAIVYSLVTANAFASLVALRLAHSLEPGPVSLLEGRAEHYTLSLPPGTWYPYTQKQTDKAHVDTALFNPSLGVDLAVVVQPIQKMADWPGLERVETGLKEAMGQLKPGLMWGKSHELPGPWDEARALTLRAWAEGLMHESAMALVRRGDKLFIIEATAPSWRSADPRPLLEELVVALRYEPPTPAFLSEALAQRVKQATVRVLTPGGRGSGFIIDAQDGYSILTAQHVLRSTLDQREPREVRVLFSGEPAVERIATVRAVDPRLDLALLHLPPDGPPCPALSLRVTPPANGIPLVASDFPWNEPFQTGVFRSQPTLHLGRMKGLQVPASSSASASPAPLIQMESGPLPRHAGGPVVDLEGAVVGMTTGGTVREASVVVSTERLLPFVKALGVRTLEGTSPPFKGGTDAFPPSVREALDAALVSVSAEHGRDPRVGVVVRVPGSQKGLVLTSAWGARTGEPVEVGFFVPASQTWKAQRGTVLVTQPYQKNTLALVEVEPFPQMPQGLALQESSHLSETDLVVLGGLREVEGIARPLQRSGAVAGIDWASRWERGPQSPARFRVALDLGGVLKPGPAVDQEGKLVGFALQRSEETNLVELVAAEPLRELLQGPVRAVAARASRDLQGDCQVELFVDARGVLSVPRTLSIAVAAPDPSREDDSLAPAFGPERELGPLPEPGGPLRLPLPACPGPTLVYRLQLTSALGVQRVEGRLPLPTRALERTQARVSLVSQEGGSLKLGDFMEWKGEEVARAPTTPEEAVAACIRSGSACGFVTQLGAAAAPRERTRLLQPLQAACRKGQGSACLGWAEVAELQATPPSPGQAGPAGARAKAGPPAQESPLPEVRTALDLGCDAGLAEACARLGQRLMRPGAPGQRPASPLEDWKRAAQLLLKACDAGSAEGCSGLAELLKRGYGVEMDGALALRRYRQACRLQDSMACLNVGYMNQSPSSYSGGLGRAYEAFREACLLGLEQGCTELPRVLDRAQ